MACFETETLVLGPVEEVFDFFCRPLNRVRLAPPDLRMQLLDGPERVALGSRFVVKVCRWGISQTLAAEVVALVLNTRIVEEQREGPFRRWVHTHEFVAAEGGTNLVERIEYEPPGGALGLLMSARAIEGELKRGYAFRQQKLSELLGSRG